MTNRDSRSLAYVGLVSVTLSALAALTMIWLIGGKVQPVLRDFWRSLPLLTSFAAGSRAELTVLVLGALVAAIAVHRQKDAALVLPLLAAFELLIAAGYGVALWLFVRDLQPFQS